jgi:ribosomal protein S18 acetylase RimI-like enzyme
MPTRIRSIQKSDLDELIRLCSDHAEYEKSDYDSVGKAEQLSQALFSENPSLNIMVLESEGKLYGYTSFMKQYSTWDAEHYCYLDCIYLDEEFRGKGWGNMLMQASRDQALGMGLKLMQWQTPDFNESAIRFYNRLGAHSKSKERFFWKL